jgi:uncharacterized protein (UPF0332 family)
MEAKDRQVLIDHRIFQAKESVKAADLLKNNQQYSAAVNRIYYGMFYMVSALALRYQYNTSHHQQLIGWFNKTFIKEKLIDAKYQRMLRAAFQNRMDADYGEFVIYSEDEIQLMLDELIDFIRQIEKLL